MNILIISTVDYSGAGHALMNAINFETAHTCRAVSYKRSRLKYPYDIFQPTQKTLEKYIKWADVVNIHGDAMHHIKSRLNKPVVTTYHGSWYRQNYKKINKRDKKMGFIPTCLTIDLAVYGSEWIGRAMPDLSSMWSPAKIFTVVHAPTQRHRKGTHTIVEAMKRVDANLDIIENVTNTECLKRKAKGHILIDQVGPKALGYGTNALEAWSMGMPVISFAKASILVAMERKIGYIPFIVAGDVQTIAEAVMQLQMDDNRYRLANAAGLKYVQEFHSPWVIARKFILTCEKAG